MKLDGLIIGEAYYLSGAGDVIYLGISPLTDSMIFRPFSNVEYITYVPIAQAAHVRESAIKRLEAVYLHDNDALHKGDELFFQNKNGIAVGRIKYLNRNSCDLTVKCITKEVHLGLLFTYDKIIGCLQTRQILRQSLPRDNDIYQEHEIQRARCCEV